MANFVKNDNSFACENCGYPVSKLNYTSRDHCPTCLYSKHVDVLPGDRKATCHGLLVPIGIKNAKKGTQIVYKCNKCSAIKHNIVAQDDDVSVIIEISKKPVRY